MDGYNSDEDCDDNNADINPGAIEIPGNDVDENCDGIIISNKNLAYFGVSIYPNPVSEVLIINSPQVLNLKLINIMGKTVLEKTITLDQNILNVEKYVNGIYTLILTDKNNNSAYQHIILE